MHNMRPWRDGTCTAELAHCDSLDHGQPCGGIWRCRTIGWLHCAEDILDRLDAIYLNLDFVHSTDCKANALISKPPMPRARGLMISRLRPGGPKRSSGRSNPPDIPSKLGRSGKRFQMESPDLDHAYFLGCSSLTRHY